MPDLMLGSVELISSLVLIIVAVIGYLAVWNRYIWACRMLKLEAMSPLEVINVFNLVKTWSEERVLPRKTRIELLLEAARTPRKAAG